MQVITDKETEIILSITEGVQHTGEYIYDTKNDIYYPPDIAEVHEVEEVPLYAVRDEWCYSKEQGFYRFFTPEQALVLRMQTANNVRIAAEKMEKLAEATQSNNEEIVATQEAVCESFEAILQDTEAEQLNQSEITDLQEAICDLYAEIEILKQQN